MFGMKTLVPGLALAGLLALTLGAQDSKIFRKAPPEVEAALRPRVDEFYKLHLQGRFREAEKLVCEDSKDAFYNMRKRQPESYEISGITYNSDFTEANVLVTIRTTTLMFGGKNQLMLMPMPTSWVVQNGTWCFHIAQPDGDTIMTPFGPMLAKAAPPNEKSANPAGLSDPSTKAVQPGKVFSGVSVAPLALRFTYGEATEKVVTVKNDLAGDISIRITRPNLPGVSVVADSLDVPRKSSVAIRVKYAPQAVKLTGTATIGFSVEPIGRVFNIDLDFGKKPATAAKR